MNELFQVVDENGKIYSGHNNVLSLYRSERTARIRLNQELKHRKANSEWRAQTNREPVEYSPLKIQRTNVTWEDVE
jgi:hypothetical protein